MKSNFHPKVAVIGLGYVGLPLAIALAKHFSVIGFDINKTRIEELQTSFDRTHEMSAQQLKTSTLQFTTESLALHERDIYIVTVPTPVTGDNLPDLTALRNASETLGKVIRQGSIVVYESTVYPGVTEDFCGPILEKISGLKCGQDFYLGYSPERINPGDKEHTIERITKVVSGQTPEIAHTLQMLYGTVNNGNIFVAENIQTAEAAKVIENAQRDINIAFINEIATIVGKLGLSIYDVLAASETKWNFLKFKPGLVGGHCIGVDPYYLAHCARQSGHEPEVILAGRHTNESMGGFIAQEIHQQLLEMGIESDARILILGLTFKEDIPDLRNTKVVDVIRELQSLGHTIDIHDPLANPTEAKAHLDLNMIASLDDIYGYDCIVGAVSHKAYLELPLNTFEKILRTGGLIADIKNMWNRAKLPEGSLYWSL